MKSERLLLVGNPEEVHVGAHLHEGAREIGLAVRFCDTRQAFVAPRWLARAQWHLAGRRPARLPAFSDSVVAACRRFEPTWLLATGQAPLSPHALEAIGKLGVQRLNFLTDDPWNPAHRAPWFLRALPLYDHVFSPRRANLATLRAHGCAAVSYLPFAYSASKHLADGTARTPPSTDIIFAGGADCDRVPPIAALIAAGFRMALYGGYWKRYPETRPYDLGLADLPTLRQAVAAARIALCLVRRANRDGHVMRTFELAAMGACMLTEDTADHREFFGAEGEAVLYFASIPEMIEKARWLLDHHAERNTLAAAAHARITGGHHTYRDRLASMLNLAVS
jgi:spore maturation protein CgeB